MTEEGAEEIIRTAGHSHDYVNGRVLKVNIGGDEFDPYLYDRDNGQGSAHTAIQIMQSTGDVAHSAIISIHDTGKELAKREIGGLGLTIRPFSPGVFQ